ncbi:MAG: AbrB/MazE/SpoVT family DNA-binding domain-containing protein [Hyphomonas sp.]|jgi:AbrB family looped-hinge helix DNA binding protein
MPTRLTQKGQVTIPKHVRDHLGLRPGSQIRFRMDQDGRAFLEPEPAAPPRSSRFAVLRGTANAGLSTEEILALTRGEGE